jgi:glyoxylase-like metal-dependent hydrolase (beta-lactamase superfamily II)
MILESFAAGPLGCNCAIVGDPESKQAIVIDPGGDFAEIQARLAKHGLVCKAIVHTHTHFDHVGATAELQEATAAAARIHEGDQFLYSILPVQAGLFGMAPPKSAELDAWLKDDEVLSIGALDVHVLHTPGHTPGSCCFEIRARGGGDDRAILFAGDTLFQRSIGRTDLWGGDHDAIVRSIRGKLFALPDPTRVICGHGPDTTIGLEKRANPFVGVGR